MVVGEGGSGEGPTGEGGTGVVGGRGVVSSEGAPAPRSIKGAIRRGDSSPNLAKNMIEVGGIL